MVEDDMPLFGVADLFCPSIMVENADFSFVKAIFPTEKKVDGLWCRSYMFRSVNATTMFLICSPRIFTCCMCAAVSHSHSSFV